MRAESIWAAATRCSCARDPARGSSGSPRRQSRRRLGVEHDEVAWRHGSRRRESSLTSASCAAGHHRAVRIVDDIENMSCRPASDGGSAIRRASDEHHVGTSEGEGVGHHCARRGDALGAHRLAHAAGRVRLLEKAVGARTPSRGEKRHRNSRAPAPPSSGRCSDLVELTGTSLAAAPNTTFIASPRRHRRRSRGAVGVDVADRVSSRPASMSASRSPGHAVRSGRDICARRRLPYRGQSAWIGAPRARARDLLRARMPPALAEHQARAALRTACSSPPDRRHQRGSVRRACQGRGAGVSSASEPRRRCVGGPAMMVRIASRAHGRGRSTRSEKLANGPRRPCARRLRAGGVFIAIPTSAAQAPLPRRRRAGRRPRAFAAPMRAPVHGCGRGLRRQIQRLRRALGRGGQRELRTGRYSRLGFLNIGAGSSRPARRPARPSLASRSRAGGDPERPSERRWNRQRFAEGGNDASPVPRRGARPPRSAQPLPAAARRRRRDARGRRAF